MALDDSITANSQTASCTVPTVGYDFYEIYIDQPDTCTSLELTVRTTFKNSDCVDTCDAHDLIDIVHDGITSKMFREPLGEAVSSVVTAYDTCSGAKIFVEFYSRHRGK